MLNKPLLLASLVILFWMTAVPTGTARAGGAAVKLKVAFGHWPPWKTSQGPEVGGIDAELVRRLGQKLGLKMEFEICPWLRCLELVRSGEVDLITSFGYRPAREEFCLYFKPAYAVQKVVVYQAKDKPQQVDSYQDLYGKTIGVIKGSGYFKPFDGDERIKRTAVETELQLFKMLTAGRVDLILGYEKAVDRLLIIKGFDRKIQKLAYRPDKGRKSYLAMSRKSAHLDLAARIGPALAEMIRGGEVDRIMADYFRRLKEK